MKLKSLILGSVAAAGLSTAGFAADLGVLTSLDVCDSLGISGLTISSDTNCLQISGGVSYQFRWGDYRTGAPFAGVTGNDMPIGYVPVIGTESQLIDTIAAGGPDGGELDYESSVTAWLKFVGTAPSDFGPASATIKLKHQEKTRYTNEGVAPFGGISYPDNTSGLVIEEAYVSIGDSTVIMAGKKSSIANFGDAQPFNYLRTFGYSEVDTGVLFQDDEDEPFTGGHVIQIVSDLGNGVSVAAGLENLRGINADDVNSEDSKTFDAGTAIGVVSYAGEGITAHLTGLAIGVLDGEVDAWGVHAGATGTFDAFKIRAAVGYRGWDNGWGAAANGFGDALYAGVDEGNELHALVSGSATFDIFTLALTGEYTRGEFDGVVDDGFGIGGSLGFAVTDGITINLGARYFSADMNSGVGGFVGDSDTTQVSAQIVAALTETIKATGEIGGYFNETVLGNPAINEANGGDDSLYYGSLGLAWAPGGGFTSSVVGEVNSQGAYRATFNAAKTFE